MPPVRIIFASAVLGISLVAAGCQSDRHVKTNSRNEVTLPPPKAMNKVSAQDKIKEAEQAESDGKFAQALECYEQLRSYPEASRPKDLDDRIKRVESRARSRQ